MFGWRSGKGACSWFSGMICLWGRREERREEGRELLFAVGFGLGVTYVRSNLIEVLCV